MADRKPEEMPTTGNQTIGQDNTKDETMHIYGSGDGIGKVQQPKGAEIMRKRGEPGTRYQE